jgi:hypothetical protein
MSCNCPCPPPIFPPLVNIAPGLSRLPRQVVGFPEYRGAMLAAIRGKPALADWRAREGDDLGVMMLEWAAYIFDVVAFYDARTTEEAYIRTARDLPSARMIAALIGHRPRPAIAARAELAAITDPNTSVTVPRGMQFRSDGFDGNPPQIFEADSGVLADSAKNQWQLAPVAPENITADAPLLFDMQSLRLAKGMVVKFGLSGTDFRLGEVAGIASYSGLDGKAYAQPVFANPVSLPAGTPLADVVATGSALTARVAGFDTSLGLLTAERIALFEAGATSFTTEQAVDLNAGVDAAIVLDGLYPQLTAGQEVVLKMTSGLDLFTITTVEVYNNIPASGTQPLPVVVATKLGLAKAGRTNVPNDTSGPITVYGNFQRAGNLALPALARIDASRVAGNLALAGLNEPLAETAGTFPLLDKRDTGAAVEGNVSVDGFGRGLLQVVKSPERGDPFVSPVRVFGNTIPISRGETVAAEVLGSAAAATPFQTFKLQRKPLTYLPSLTAASGYVSTLQIRVNGLLWDEVDSFFGAGPSDQVYIVRHDEAGETAVTFGDGNYGAFPPVGSNNVIATYRTGAGSIKPPAMTIRQAVSPLKRLSQIFNPLGASGGADAESPDQIRTQAAIGALTFGRAVSLADFEAMARSYAGIVNAIAGWAWDDALQRAVVTIWYIADGGDPTADLRNWLAARADPAIEISVRPATAVPVNLVTAMDFDAAFDGTVVEASVIAALTDTQSGILSHARAPIGGSIFLSAIFEAVLAVPGVQAITNLTTAVGTAAAAPAPFALTAAEGTFLDFLPFDNR